MDFQVVLLLHFYVLFQDSLIAHIILQSGNTKVDTVIVFLGSEINNIPIGNIYTERALGSQFTK